MSSENNPSTIAEARTNPPDSKQAEVLSHSGLGIGSFIISIVASILMMIAITRIMLLGTGHTDPQELDMMIVGFTIILAMFLQAIGLTLGIVGLCQKKSRKTFSILGTVINGAGLLFILFMLILGLAAGNNQ